MKKAMLFLMLMSVSGSLFAVCGTGYTEYTGTEYVVVDGDCPDGYDTVYTNSEVPASYTGGTINGTDASACIFEF